MLISVHFSFHQSKSLEIDSHRKNLDQHSQCNKVKEILSWCFITLMEKLAVRDSSSSSKKMEEICVGAAWVPPQTPFNQLDM